MIDIFLLLLTIIVIFSISILIYTIINNKEGFTNIYDTKDIKEARLKLNLEKNLINYQKGSKGFNGEKGKQGALPIPSDDGPIGGIGDPGVNGKNYGSLIFKNEEDDVIDDLINKNIKGLNHPNFNIKVPNAEKGTTGFVGTILFVNHKKEIIGSYYPTDEYAKTLKPIIIDVPQGIVGEPGKNGSDNSHPQGPQGKIGKMGDQGTIGERGDPGQDADKGTIGGGGDEDIFNNVKVGNKVCFKEDSNVCIDIDIMKTLVNYNDELKKLENRRLRIIRKLCYFEFYEEYNNEKHENRDELIIEYHRQLQEIYDFNEKVLNYEEIVNKDTGTCPEFPEKNECKFNENHLNNENQYLFDKCRCEKMTTNCGNGMFISREAYKSKDDKNRDVYVSDNKCANCTLERWSGENDNDELYVGCDGVYDGIAAKCTANQYIELTSGPKTYNCKDCGVCPSKHYKTGGCKGLQKNTCDKCKDCSSSQYEVKGCDHNHNRECGFCKTSCPAGKYLKGNCGGNGTGQNDCVTCTAGYFCPGDIHQHRCAPGSISGPGAANCSPCLCGQYIKDNTCQWLPAFYQYYHHNGEGGCSNIINSIPYNHSGWNRVTSSILIPAGKTVSIYTGGNYSGECAEKKAGGSPEIWNIPSSHNDKVESIRINGGCYVGRAFCYKDCGKIRGGDCDACGKGHRCCRESYKGGTCEYWDGNTFDHVCIRGFGS